MLRLVEARHLHDYVLWVRFNDGAEGEIDLRDELLGEVFEPLQEMKLFRSFSVSPDLHTITWPNGADLAPEFLHSLIRVQAA